MVYLGEIYPLTTAASLGDESMCNSQTINELIVLRSSGFELLCCMLFLSRRPVSILVTPAMNAVDLFAGRLPVTVLQPGPLLTASTPMLLTRRQPTKAIHNVSVISSLDSITVRSFLQAVPPSSAVLGSWTRKFRNFAMVLYATFDRRGFLTMFFYRFWGGPRVLGDPGPRGTSVNR